jgi:hypothetical protein
MKKLLLVSLIFLLCCKTTNITYYKPFYPDDIKYVKETGFIRSFEDSSAVACGYYPGDENYFAFVIKNYNKELINYDDLNIYLTGHTYDKISFYKADETLKIIQRKINSTESIPSYLISGNPDLSGILEGTMRIKCNSTILSEEHQANIERLKKKNRILKEQAYAMGAGMKKITDDLLFLPSNDTLLIGNIQLKNKPLGPFTVNIKIGNDLHEFKFIKVKMN